MDVTCFVYVYEDTSENTIENGDEWCRHLIAKFNLRFPDLCIAFGGNAAASGTTYRTSLYQEFLKDNVAGLAMMVYEEEIRDHTYFMTSLS